jgi:hypothetical protein
VVESYGEEGFGGVGDIGEEMILAFNGIAPNIIWCWKPIVVKEVT